MAEAAGTAIFSAKTMALRSKRPGVEAEPVAFARPHAGSKTFAALCVWTTGITGAATVYRQEAWRSLKGRRRLDRLDSLRELTLG